MAFLCVSAPLYSSSDERITQSRQTRAYLSFNNSNTNRKDDIKDIGNKSQDEINPLEEDNENKKKPIDEEVIKLYYRIIVRVSEGIISSMVSIVEYLIAI